MGRFGRDVSRTFRSLRNTNYRLYFVGQVVSLTGTWMQSVAQAWLVLRLTGSGLALGTTAALQFAPVLVAGPWGGVIADRVDKRRLVMWTQAAAGLLALTLGLLTLFHVVRLWMVYGLALGLGIVNLVDMPTRQSFVMEMVGAEDLINAVSLNSVVVNGARIVGPAMAGILIAAVGLAPCFLINAGSYLAVIAALLAMDTSRLTRAAPVARGPGQLRAGLRYAWSRADLREPLLMMAVVGTLAYNFSVVLPLFAETTFGAGARAYGALFSVMGAGAVLGGLVVASRARTGLPFLAGAAVGFGLAIGIAAVAPSLGLATLAMLPVGAGSTAFIATSNSMLQLNSSPEMRGRVMALFSLVFLGTTPVGGPLVGWIAERFGPRSALGVAAVATVLTGLAGILAVRRSARRRRQERPATSGAGAELLGEGGPG
ncbi:MAG: MFS transporter [Actinobacteria bacterium]|nr:MAG: MFS transporter [Actinomycetota bacterium]